MPDADNSPLIIDLGPVVLHATAQTKDDPKVGKDAGDSAGAGESPD